MNEKVHKELPQQEKGLVTSAIRKLFEQHSEISFAYLHGSFTKDEGFRDIDVAVYLTQPSPSTLQYELELEAASRAVSPGFPVDVRVLNGALLSFRYSVIKEGILLFAKDDDEQADFVESTLSAYFDFAPYRALYLKETLGLEV